MKVKKKVALKDNLIVFLLLFEYILLPKNVVIGSMKVCHFIILLWPIFNIFHMRGFIVGPNAEWLIKRVYCLILLGLFGELTLLAYTSIVGNTQTLDFLVLFLNMISAVGIGYNHHRFDKRILLYLLYANIALNLMVTIVGENQPSFFRLFWASYRDAGVRNHGLVGNANSSMAIMNVMLLSVVVLYRKKLLELRGIHFYLVFFLPLVCVLFINSRGEFISTVLLEVYLLFSLFKNESRKRKDVIIIRIIIASILAFFVYFMIFHVFVYMFPRLQSSLTRLGTLSSFFDTSSGSKSENAFRPLYGFDPFFVRFVKSPIWGSGFDTGLADSFNHRVGYHNDFYAIIVSTGVIGFCLWISIISRSVKYCGWIMLIPLLITGLSNTFLYSNACVTVYFLLFGILSRDVELIPRHHSWPD